MDHTWLPYHTDDEEARFSAGVGALKGSVVRAAQNRDPNSWHAAIIPLIPVYVTELGIGGSVNWTQLLW